MRNFKPLVKTCGGFIAICSANSLFLRTANRTLTLFNKSCQNPVSYILGEKWRKTILGLLAFAVQFGSCKREK